VLGMDSEDLWHGPHLRPRRRRRSMTSVQASWVFAQAVCRDIAMARNWGAGRRRLCATRLLGAEARSA
jgi:hypothetical protein